MSRKWIMLWSLLLLVALGGQSAAIQVSQTVNPASPKKDAKITFNITITNNETVNMTDIGVNIGYSWDPASSDSLLSDRPSRDELTAGPVAPAGKVTFHLEINLKNEGLSAGKSYAYNYTVVYWHMDGNQRVNQTFYTTPNYTFKTASNPAPAKSPGFEGLLLVPAVVLAAMLAWRKCR